MTSKSKKYCSVPMCSNYISENVSMHFFPKDLKLTKEWKIKLKIGKPISQYMYVCSEHFLPEDFTLNTREKKLKRLKKGVIPSQKLPMCKTDRKINRSNRARLRTERRDVCRNEVIVESELVPDISMDNEVESELVPDISVDEVLPVRKSENQYGTCKMPIITEPLDAFVDKEVQTNFPTFSLIDSLQSDYRIKCSTGVDAAVITALERCSINILNVNSEDTPDNLRMRIVLVLTKLKCNLSFRFLAILFNLSRTTCTRYFYFTLALLAKVLQPLVYWPSKEDILANMPKCFEKFKNTSVVLDCTEVPVQKSKCLKTRIKSYSHYKGTQTFKVLIGITPSGLISYVSPGYGGRASDKGIFNKENLISKLDPYDAVMVDKGFMIEKECEDYFIKLIRPPFLKKKKQFSKEEANVTADIARARIHVERAIQRLKLYKIISSQIEWYMIPHMDEVMIVIAGLVNLAPPIMSIERF